jgi:N-acetylmuramoyl-L-alanine amidase
VDVTLLRTGTHGPVVRELQDRLTAAGFATPADGRFGPETEASVRAFQRTRGLLVDGICGPETWGALVESAYRLGDRLLYRRRPMLRGDDVAELQRRLNALGFDAGREDGILGPETEDAIRRFQRDAGLVSDATCGPETVDALERLGSLSEGSVARVREREALRRDVRRLEDRGCFVVADPGLAVLAAEVARRLRELGAVVALDASGTEPGRVAAEANEFAADVFLALGTGTAPGVRCAYFATEHFRSEAGFAIARQLTAALRSVLPDVEAPVGRTYQLLRETRMAAVVCECFSREDPAGATTLTTRVPRLAAAIVDGVRRGVEAPLDLTPDAVSRPSRAHRRS